MTRFYDQKRRAASCRRKLDRCIRFARESNLDWIDTGARPFKQMRDEAMHDARYWKQELQQCKPEPTT